ncbi:hypothetical protein Ndes2437B_g06204 [Nannochloris sp. 'desiccata']
MAPWIQDAVVENTPLSTTGGHTWKAAYRLANYFSSTAANIGLNGGPQINKINILELGAGCGYLGITVARNLPNANIVCLTEQEDGGALSWLRHNVELNRNRGLPLDAVTVQPCDWLTYCQETGATTSILNSSYDVKPCIEADEGINQQELVLEGTINEKSPPVLVPSLLASPLCFEAITWDFIVGSDLIYNKIGSTCLPRVLSALSSAPTQIFYCHTKHRFDLLDLEFFENLTAVGLKFEEVWEPEAEAPPESPPLQFPPSDLFPEQRVAIFKITSM